MLSSIENNGEWFENSARVMGKIDEKFMLEHKSRAITACLQPDENLMKTILEKRVESKVEAHNSCLAAMDMNKWR